MSASRLLPLLCLVLALGAVSAADATPPGPNGRIAFALDGGGGGDLYSVNPGGSGLTRLTWSAQAEAPAWSPDGTRIAYESLLGGHLHIWVMNADGSGQTQLTFSSGVGEDADPTWSPDGAQIAFGSTRAGAWNLWVMSADGGSLRRVSDVFGDDPAWSPDGRRLAYLGLDGVGVVGVDGGDPHVVSAPGSAAGAPSWSPDGTQIVFSRNSPGGYPGELYVANVDGSSERQLTSGGAANAAPSWSPDGSQIVFQRSTMPPSGWSLWTIAVDGSGLRQLPYNGGNEIGPDWGSSLVAPLPPDAPVIQIFSPASGKAYLPSTQVPAFYLCSSKVSHIVSCDGDVPFGALLDFSQAGTRTFTVRALDAQGRTATASVSYQVFDLVPPQIDIRTPADGATYELGDQVSVDYSCADPNGTGVAACVGDLPVAAPLDTSRAGTFRFRVLAVDNSRNISQAQATYSVVDPRPAIHITSPGTDSTYTLGDTVAAAYSCASLSGAHIVTCAGPVASGNAIETSTVGAKTFTVNASDDRGKSASATRSYSVVYAFAGFDSPVSASGSIDDAKPGDSLPLKFTLHGNQGLAAITRTSWQASSCTDWSALDAPTAAQTKLSYNASTDRYLDLVSTDPTWKGTCRTAQVQLADGTHHDVHVHFTK